jgi:hypothetical protein
MGIRCLLFRLAPESWLLLVARQCENNNAWLEMERSTGNRH